MDVALSLLLQARRRHLSLYLQDAHSTRVVLMHQIFAELKFRFYATLVLKVQFLHVT